MLSLAVTFTIIMLSLNKLIGTDRQAGEQTQVGIGRSVPPNLVQS